MKKLSPDLILQKNKVATASAWLLLMDIWLNDEAGTRFRLVQNNEDFILGSDNYTDAECVAHYKLDDSDVNTDVADASGNGNDGSASANTDTFSSATAKLGKSLHFNGSSHYVDCGVGSNFGLGDEFTISAWIRKDTNADYHRVITNRLDTNSQISLYTTATGVLRLLVGDGVSYEIFSFATTMLSIDTWYHVVATVTADEVTITVNGVTEAFTKTTGTPYTSGNFYIGARQVTTSGYFDGYIDDVKIYKRALSNAEILVEYNADNGTEKLPVVYNAFNFELDDISQDNKGQVPKINARVCNISRFLQPYMGQLKGGVGSVVILKVINTDLPVEDYTETSMEFNVLASNTTREWVTFTLGSSNPLRKRFPLYKMNGLHCGWTFNRPLGLFPECGYSGKSIAGITLTSGNPVSIQVAGHLFETGDIVNFLDVDGTVELNGNSYTVTKTDANNFTLDSTDGDDFTAWGTVGGTVGFASCDKTLIDCRLRQNSTMFGGNPGMRSKSVRIV